MSDQKTIAIIGGTIWGNRGAESMLVTTIGKLRESFPNAKFNAFSYYPSKDRELIKDKNIKIVSSKPLSLPTKHFFGALIGLIFLKLGLKIPKGKFFEIARALHASDILLEIGGITFSDGREKFLPFNVLTIWPAMLLGVPVVKLAQALGPFKNWLNQFLAKIFLPCCKHIFARGEGTANYLSSIGLIEIVDTVADIAFLYKPLYSLSNENEARVFDLLKSIQSEKESGRKIIVVSPSVLVDKQSRKAGQDYPGFFFDLIKSDKKDEFSYIFIPNASREGSDQSHNNDLNLIKKLQALFGDGFVSEEVSSHVFWVDFDINTEWIRNIIHEADVLVTSRFHAMISGLTLKIPSIVVGWGHKYTETMAYFDMEEYCINFREINCDLRSLIKKVLSDRKEIAEKYDLYLPEVLEKAKVQFDYLSRELS